MHKLQKRTLLLFYIFTLGISGLFMFFGTAQTNAYTNTTTGSGGGRFICDSPDYFEAHLQPDSSEQLFSITQNRLGDSLLVSIRCYSGAEIRVVDSLLDTREDFFLLMSCGVPGNYGEITFSDEARNAGTGQNLIQVTCNDADNFIYDVSGNYGGCSSNSLDSPCVPTAVESRFVGERPDTATDADANDSCNKKGGSFSFILCPLLGLTDEAFRWLDERIIDALNVNSDYYSPNDGNSGVKGAWANFRNIAYLLLIPILLFMVIGTALGFTFVDAYTVKRAMPRLLVAIIFIALSFEITSLMIEITNDIGRATAGLIAAPFGGLDDLQIDDLFEANLGNDVAFAGGAVVGGIIAFLTGVTIWGIAITLGLAVIAMIVVFVLLTLREMLIIFLMILAPIAILSWIFPGNDKLWKLWWNAFSKMLIIFPLIIALLVSGRAFASVINDTGSQEGIVITTMIKIIAIVAPYFLIPSMFKFAGGALGNIAGIVNNKEKGFFDRARNRRDKSKENASKRRVKDLKNNNLFKGVDEKSRRGRINTRLGTLMNQGQAGYTLNMQRRRDRITGSHDAHSLAEGLQEAGEGAAGQLFASDDLMMAGLEGGGDLTRTRNYLASRVDENGNRNYTDQQVGVMAEQVLDQRKQMGARKFELTALAKLPSTGTAFVGEDGIQDWLQRIEGASEGNGSLKASLVAQGKSGFRSAQRYSVSEASFGLLMGAAQDMGRATTDAERESIVYRVIKSGYESGGAAAVVGARNDKEARVFSRVINAELDAAEQRYTANPTIENRTEVVRQKAAIAAIQESIGQAKQSVSKVLGAEVMGRKVQVAEYRDEPVTVEVTVDTGLIDPSGKPVMRTERRETGEVRRVATGNTREGNRVEDLQQIASDSVFQQFKREYIAAIDQAAAQQAQAAGGAVGGPTLGGGPQIPTPGKGI